MFRVLNIFVHKQMAAESIENIRTVAALSLERKFYNRYCQYLEEPFK